MELQAKSERWGQPFASMRTLDCIDGVSGDEDGRMGPTYSFQISVDNFVVVQIVETAGYPNQLQSSEHRIELPML